MERTRFVSWNKDSASKPGLLSHSGGKCCCRSKSVSHVFAKTAEELAGLEQFFAFAFVGFELSAAERKLDLQEPEDNVSSSNHLSCLHTSHLTLSTEDEDLV